MSIGSPDRIDTMPSRFRAAGHRLTTPPVFAAAILARVRADVVSALQAGDVVPSTQAAALYVTLGDPAAPAPHPRDVRAYVNSGRWIAKDDGCGGCEYVDPDNPIFMCCSCWNAADGHAWRGVRIPPPPVREAIEAVLLARPDPTTRNWRYGESVDDLDRENADHGLPPRRAA